jgi:hypothetical protein
LLRGQRASGRAFRVRWRIGRTIGPCRCVGTASSTLKPTCRRTKCWTCDNVQSHDSRVIYCSATCSCSHDTWPACSPQRVRPICCSPTASITDLSLLRRTHHTTHQKRAKPGLATSTTSQSLRSSQAETARSETSLPAAEMGAQSPCLWRGGRRYLRA